MKFLQIFLCWFLHHSSDKPLNIKLVYFIFNVFLQGTLIWFLEITTVFGLSLNFSNFFRTRNLETLKEFQKLIELITYRNLKLVS